MLKSNAECVAGQPPTPVRPFLLDPHAAAAVVLRPSPATFVRPSVGVMNKCQTSSPSELDPCAPRVRRVKAVANGDMSSFGRRSIIIM